jgi:Fe-S cluster biogenesis protein NfuA
MITVSHTEGTPNPNALKYVCDTTLVKQGALSFDNAVEGADSDLAKGIFAVGGINSVYIQENFVAVNAKPQANWEQVRQAVEEGLKNFTPIESAQPKEADESTGDALLDKINSTVERFVRPALASDGGGIEVEGLEGTTVLVRYQGACGGCGMSTSGTLMAIENLLQREVDENLTVQAV